MTRHWDLNPDSLVPQLTVLPSRLAGGKANVMAQVIGGAWGLNCLVNCGCIGLAWAVCLPCMFASPSVPLTPHVTFSIRISA